MEHHDVSVSAQWPVVSSDFNFERAYVLSVEDIAEKVERLAILYGGIVP